MQRPPNKGKANVSKEIKKSIGLSTTAQTMIKLYKDLRKINLPNNDPVLLQCIKLDAATAHSKVHLGAIAASNVGANTSTINTNMGLLVRHRKEEHVNSFSREYERLKQTDRTLEDTRIKLEHEYNALHSEQNKSITQLLQEYIEGKMPVAKVLDALKPHITSIEKLAHDLMKLSGEQKVLMREQEHFIDQTHQTILTVGIPTQEGVTPTHR